MDLLSFNHHQLISSNFPDLDLTADPDALTSVLEPVILNSQEKVSR
jgi:hypothetical protein